MLLDVLASEKLRRLRAFQLTFPRHFNVRLWSLYAHHRKALIRRQRESTPTQKLAPFQRLAHVVK